MNLQSLLGFAGSFTAASLFFPQVIKAWQTKETKDLSWYTLYLGLANGIFWTTYGFLKNDAFIYITNSLLFLAILMLSILKRKYG